MPQFRVALSGDLRPPDPAVADTSWGDLGLAALARAGLAYDFLPADDGALTADQVEGYDAVLFAAPAITPATVAGPTPPRILARFGVGLDSVDLAACTTAGTAVTITPDGARRPVAAAALTLILAVGHNLLAKDLIVREGRWSDRMPLMGRGLTGRTVGTLGLGNIAQELFALLVPFDTRNLATDPHRDAAEAAELGVELVGLDELLERSDVVVVTAALTADTSGLFNADRLGRMRRDAILINVARGPIVDLDALAMALTAGGLGGAGLDVFDPEPLPAHHPITSAPNVVLAPHALAWTDEMALGNGSSAVRAILDVRSGRRPSYLANPEVLDHPRFATMKSAS